MKPDASSHWVQCTEHKASLALVILTVIIYTLLGLAGPYLMGLGIDKFITGQRIEFMGSTFETNKPVHLSVDVISTGTSGNHDLLEDVPIF